MIRDHVHQFALMSQQKQIDIPKLGIQRIQQAKQTSFRSAQFQGMRYN
jgi:hypothetical protein